MKQECDIGIVGLGVMGRNLMLNLADHNFNVAGFDIDSNKVKSLINEQNSGLLATSKIEEFVNFLSRPRAVLLLVPAGAPVDSAINDIADHLQPEDIIIDAGNSYFRDTDRRASKLAERRIRFMGVGISGGEDGARNGASIMPGGTEEAWKRVRPMLEAVAARVDGAPCATLLGSGSSGHFVKMVHNGIEYGLMQLIAESYDLMKRSLGLDDDKLHDIYSEWNLGELDSYLIGITGEIFVAPDEKSGGRLINVIRDVARQKGTGMWTSQSAMELQVPIPSIDAAVMMRNLSVFQKERSQIGKIIGKTVKQFEGKDILDKLKNALYAAMMITYSQGMALLAAASGKYKYGLKLEEVTRVWKGGCIIRSALLIDIGDAFSKSPDLSNLLLDKNISGKIGDRISHLREVAGYASGMGIPVPSMMASLAWFDAFRSEWSPANLIQAQRDYFGAHTYERIDEEGTFHTDWLKLKVHENISH
jgi:6-phosphogluconate dehydrogenase